MWPAAIATTRFLLLTEWRRSEVLGFRWKEIDLARRTARLEDTKTGLSVRPLSEAACEILRGQETGKLDALVFPATRGEGIMGGLPWFGMHRASGRAAVRHLAHVLRHLFASLAADHGYSEPTIATMIGHQGQSMTSRYVHAADAVLWLQLTR